MKLALLLSVAILFSSSARGDRFYLEPEIGVFVGRYEQTNTRGVAGLQAGTSFGFQWGTHQIGLEFHARYFESEAPGSLSFLTNIPIGIGFRTEVAENWRLLLAWHWDDVLYREFFLKNQGLKIPKDYDLAQEGPGSWKVGVSRRLSSGTCLNATMWIQSYETYKRRRPAEVIGSVDPTLSLITLATTVSFLF